MSQDSKAFASSLETATSIVAAYVSNNSLRAADLPELIFAVHSSLRHLASGSQPVPEPEAHEPAVPVRKSVTRDYVVCLEDGKRFKSLRRHLSAHHQLTPEQYRTKWGLPRDHPMVAPSYSATRSQLAKDSGLGLPAGKPTESVPGKRGRDAAKGRRGRPRMASSA